MTDRRMIRRRRRQQNKYHLPIAMIIATTALLLLSLSISTVSATATTNQQVQTLRGARRRIQSPTNTRNLKKKKGDGDETAGLFAHKQNRIDPTTGEIINNTSKKHKKTKTHIDKEGRLVDINGNLLDKKGRQITLPERCKKPKELIKVEEKELKEQLKQAEKEAQKNKEQQAKPVVPFEEVGDIKEQREDTTTATTTDEGLVKKTSSSVVGDKKKGSPLSSPPAPSPSTPFLQIERSIDPITGEWKPPHTSSPITQAEAEAIQLAKEQAEQAAIEAAAEGFDVFGGSLGEEGSTSLEELQTTVISNSMCDEDGNLLPSYASFSPTITPPLDEGDDDNDGLLNWQEDEYGTNKTNVDSDGDGLTDSQEIILGTDPLKVDTDGDGVDDYTELMDGTNPLDEMDFNKQDLVDTAEGADNDGDGLFNEQEIELGTDVDNADTDGDGLSDGMEVIYQQTDPLKVDTDSDGLTDYEEVMIHGTNPNNPDSDGDGYSDGFEISQNLDPLVPNDYSSDPLAISPGCESYMNDTVYVTSIPAAIDLEYEVSIDELADIDIVNERMENVMAKLIGETLINCGQLSSDSEQVVGEDGAVRRTRRRRSLTSRHLLVDGIDPSPQDIILTKKTCSYYTADNTDTPSNTKCYVIKSLSKLYLREDNAQSSPYHSSQQALRILLDAMNSPSPSPFLESSGDREYSVEGVKGVRYIMGTPDEGGVLLIDNSGGSGLNNGDGIDGAQEADTNSDGDGSLDPLSPVGITLIVLGCVGILAIALVAGRNIRKRKDNGQKKSLQYAEFYDDENDLDMKHHGLEDDDDKFTDRDASSLHGTPSPKRSRRDHREDDSIFSGLESPGNETTTLDPAFIHTRTSNHNRDDGSQSQITAEQGYEAGGMQFYPRDPFPRSKYEPKVQVESPKYENPAGMKQPPERNGRVYHVGDTVEF